MGNQKKSELNRLTTEFYQLHPQEMLVKERSKRKDPIRLGIPKETSFQEKRISIRPEAVSVLVNNGFEILVETNAGAYAKYTDQDYAEAGAVIVYSPKEVFETDIVLKISPPTLEEIGYMKKGKTIISALHQSMLSDEYFLALMEKEITALGFDMLEDEVGGLPIVRAMSEIAGSTVMLIASEYLSASNGGKGIILGGITGVPPSKVVILGAGTVAEYAARTAIGLGAEVKIFDNHIYKLARLKQSIGQPNLYTSTFDNVVLADALIRCDVAIGALRSETGRAPTVVTEEVVARMRANSVVIDVSIDQGGCFETSEVTDLASPTFRKHDVIHYCVPNIASRVARTATHALSNIFTPILNQMAELGSVDQMLYQHQWFARGVYAYRGGITHKGIADRFGMPFKNLELILAARF